MHEIFRKQIEGDKLHHSYLLIGDPKLAMAEIESVMQALKISPADRTVFGFEDIAIAGVRALIKQVQLKPHSSSYKAVSLPANFLGGEAAQALLKTLEEPPARTIFFLHTPNEQLVAPTVVSRCQRIYVGEYQIATVAKSFEEIIRMPLPERFEFLNELVDSQSHLLAVDQWLIELHNNEHKMEKLDVIKDMLELKRRLQANVNAKLQLEAFFYNLP